MLPDSGPTLKRTEHDSITLPSSTSKERSSSSAEARTPAKSRRVYSLRLTLCSPSATMCCPCIARRTQAAKETPLSSSVFPEREKPHCQPIRSANLLATTNTDGHLTTSSSTLKADVMRRPSTCPPKR